MDLDIIHTDIKMAEAPFTPSYSWCTRRGSPGCSSEPCAICCRTSCCGRGRAPGPITGEHWCHVTRSPPTTAHLGPPLVHGAGHGVVGAAAQPAQAAAGDEGLCARHTRRSFHNRAWTAEYGHLKTHFSGLFCMFMNTFIHQKYRYSSDSTV